MLADRRRQLRDDDRSEREKVSVPQSRRQGNAEGNAEKHTQTGRDKMNKKTYFLAIYENELGTFSGSFADFDCVCDDGDTMDELISNAKELLNFTIAYMVEHNQPLPAASEGRAYKAKLKEKPLCIVPVTVYPPAKTERINITAPGDQIAEITDYTKHNKLSRSELMVKAALNYIRSNA